MTHNLDSICYHILNLLDLVELVPAHDVITTANHHAGHKTSKGGNAVSLANAEHTSVDVRGASLKGSVAVGDGAAGVVMEMYLDVARHDAAEGADEVVDLAGGSATDGVSNTYAVNADSVDGAVELEKVDEVGPKAVLGREADLDSSALDVVDDLDGGLLNGYHVLAVGVLPQEARCADDEINAVH